MNARRWCMTLFFVLLLAILASPAFAQTDYQDPETCFGSFSYPGHHIGITTRVHMETTGQDYWYWHEADNYVDNGAPGYPGLPVTTWNNAMSCETDFYDGEGGFWNFDDYKYFHVPVTHRLVAHPYYFNHRETDIAICSHAFPQIVEIAVFREGAIQPWYEGIWAPPGGLLPIAQYDQQVYIPFGQEAYEVYAKTCGSTYPAPYFTVYTWKTFYFGVYWGNESWVNWWDASDIWESNYYVS